VDVALASRMLTAYGDLVSEGFSALANGDVAAAVERFGSAIALNDGPAEAHFLLGIALAQAELWEEALNEWERVAPPSWLATEAEELTKRLRQVLRLRDELLLPTDQDASEAVARVEKIRDSLNRSFLVEAELFLRMSQAQQPENHFWYALARDLASAKTKGVLAYE